MTTQPILLAGGTGDLGGRIARALVDRGAAVRALVRPGAAADKVAHLRGLGVEIAEAEYDDPRRCAGRAPARHAWCPRSAGCAR
ncbi:uncharacterized protein YbjT (DUF2867 family) [Longimicrobium terrae]|uniref:Uncharacterized protein YbjT (DUF2867 family) n=1 Tax=Longimicrobium terrae TaxID=1639882 RepID=A0A841H6B7_9BACT|nr:NmrA family NAD(P)-binding protein [Longimicrobium terrae]MBB4639234.1 uncharacterized protein YbjT (DUF2867 family) [Longimicrobium terrae]MBB6073474.1 uncharacterized protein YbjT (DUF2867 family) [Longimicrobium terrae]